VHFWRLVINAVLVPRTLLIRSMNSIPMNCLLTALQFAFRLIRGTDKFAHGTARRDRSTGKKEASRGNERQLYRCLLRWIREWHSRREGLLPSSNNRRRVLCSAISLPQPRREPKSRSACSNAEPTRSKFTKRTARGNLNAFFLKSIDRSCGSSCDDTHTHPPPPLPPVLEIIH